jgi:membrane-associated protease RseP (regulator of RpoE activity)
MKIRQFGVIVVVFAAGFLVATLVRPGRPPEALPAAHQPDTSIVRDTNDERLRADLERQVAELKSQLQAASLRADATSAPVSAPVPRTREDVQNSADKASSRIQQARAALDKDKLLAAGYSLERIESIQKRSQQLQDEYTKERQLLKGGMDADVLASHFHDNDIGLRRELGDAEYARYRQALGRPIGMEVGGVAQGSRGEAAGLKVGDQIISYNGSRIFNVGELQPEVRKYASSGTTIAVDVVRNGQTIRVNVPAGNLGIQSKMPDSMGQIAELSPKLLEIFNAENKQKGGAN